MDDPSIPVAVFEPRARIHGVVPGIVVDTADPEGLGRVRVELAVLRSGDGQAQRSFLTDWARLALPAAGPGRGAVWVPDVGDEVLVAFEWGDPAAPYVVGCLHNGSDRPPGQWRGERATHRRLWRSRAGHVLALDEGDDGGACRIVLQACVDTDAVDDEPQSRPGACLVLDESAGGRFIELRAHDGRVVVRLDAETGRVDIDAPHGDVRIHAAEAVRIACRDFRVEASGSVGIESGGRLEVRAKSDATVDGGSSLRLRAGRIDLN